MAEWLPRAVGGGFRAECGASGLQFRQDVGDVGLVERRERKALHAEVVEGCAYVNEG